MTEAIEDLQQPVEDTVLPRDGEIELLTGTLELPALSTQAGKSGSPVRRARQHRLFRDRL